MRTRDNRVDGLQALRRKIRALEQGGEAGAEAQPVRFGVPVIDSRLPWGGLARGGLHEVGGTSGAAAGFLTGILRRAAGEAGRILWCRPSRTERETGVPYGPGLAGFGIAPGQVLFVRAPKPVDVLWAMEEGLRSPALAAVVGDGLGPDFTATRRLQLAAEMTGVPVFVLPPGEAGLSAALTRWRIDALPSGGEGLRWRAELWRCRGGVPTSWIVEWDEQALRFRVADALAGRAAAAG